MKTTKVLVQMSTDLKDDLERLAKELTEKDGGVRRVSLSELIREGCVEVIKKYQK